MPAAHARIVAASEADVPALLRMIKALADYEKLADQVVATEDRLRASLFPSGPGARRVAEAVIALVDEQPAGFALFFHNFSTFLCRKGLYLEDLFVRPSARGTGLGKRLLALISDRTVDPAAPPEGGCDLAIAADPDAATLTALAGSLSSRKIVPRENVKTKRAAWCAAARAASRTA